MATRVTPLRLTACLALAAMWTLAGVASACGDSKDKTASAAGSCRVSKVATTATAQPAAKVAAKPAAAAAPTAVAVPAPAVGYRALPGITQPAPFVSGLRAFIDPETGELVGPTNGFVVPDDVARMIAAPVELTPITLPGGGVLLDLQGTGQDFYVLTIDPLGRRSIRCVQDARHAQVPVPPAVQPMPVR